MPQVGLYGLCLVNNSLFFSSTSVCHASPLYIAYLRSLLKFCIDQSPCSCSPLKRDLYAETTGFSVYDPKCLASLILISKFLLQSRENSGRFWNPGLEKTRIFVTSRRISPLLPWYPRPVGYMYRKGPCRTAFCPIVVIYSRYILYCIYCIYTVGWDEI